jgi:hypothetical protein
MKKTDTSHYGRDEFLKSCAIGLKHSKMKLFLVEITLQRSSDHLGSHRPFIVISLRNSRFSITGRRLPVGEGKRNSRQYRTRTAPVGEMKGDFSRREKTNTRVPHRETKDMLSLMPTTEAAYAEESEEVIRNPGGFPPKRLVKLEVFL